MKLTAFYKLRKPEGKDVVDVDDFNYNFDEIDTALNEAANASGDLSNGKVFTSMATSRVAPASGDTLAVIISKVMKWLNDLGAAAFKSVANNSTTTADGYVADARALTAVANRVATLESSFPDGCRTIARAITAGRGTYASPVNGVSTADNASPTTMAGNIKTLATNNYNAAKVGTAAAGDVLAGKTFTNSSTVGAQGSLADYRNNVQTIATTATGGSPTGTRPDSVMAWTEDLSIAAGVHNKVRVNKLASYKQGVTDADNRVNTNSVNYNGGVNSVLGVTSTNKGNFHSYKNYGSDGWGYFSFPVPVGASTIHYSGVWVNYGDAAHPTANIGNGASVVSYRGQYINVCYNSNANSEFDGSFWFA